MGYPIRYRLPNRKEFRILFHRHTVGVLWAKHFLHPCFEVETYGLADGGEIRVRAARCSVNVRLRVGRHSGERGLGQNGELIYANRPVGSLIFIPTATWVTLCSDGGGEYASVRFDPSYLKSLAPAEASAASDDVIPPFTLPELDALMRRMAERVGDATHEEMEPMARSVGVLLTRHMAFSHVQTAGSVFRSRLPAVLAHIEAHLADDLPLDKLAAMAGMSVSAFRRNFALVTGLPPHKFIMAARVRRAQALLMDDSLSLAEIAYTVGFGTQSRFCTVFREVAGVTPSEYRRRLAA